MCACWWACGFAEGVREEPGVEETRLPGQGSPVPDGEVAGPILQKGPWVPELATMLIPPRAPRRQAPCRDPGGRGGPALPRALCCLWHTAPLSLPRLLAPAPPQPHSPFPSGKVGGVPCEAVSLCLGRAEMGICFLRSRKLLILQCGNKKVTFLHFAGPRLDHTLPWGREMALCRPWIFLAGYLWLKLQYYVE